MNDVITFSDTTNLPAYVRNLNSLATLFAETEKDIQQFASYPTISIKGKTWTLVEGGERKVMMKPGGEEGEIAQFIEGVIVHSNDKARTYYAKRFTEQSAAEGEKPTCYSMDGIAPSPRSIEAQSPKCGSCQWSVFGSATKEDGTAGKGTACASNARLAFATVDKIDNPYLLRIPPKSLKPLRDAVAVLRERKIPYPVVVFRLGFDPQEASPVVTFRPVGLLSDDKAEKSISMRDASVVRQIIGLDEREVSQPTPPAPAATQSTTPELDAAIAARAAAVPSPAPVTAPAPIAPPPPVAPPPPTAVAAQPAQPTVTVIPAGGGNDSLLAELNGLLGKIDK